METHRTKHNAVAASPRERETLNFITTLLDASTEYAIIGLAQDGRILLWNEGAHRIYGYEPAEVVGRAFLHLLSPPEEKAHENMLALLETVAHARKWEGILTQIRKNRQSFPSRMVITARQDQDGNMVGSLVIAKDISNEVRLEELTVIQTYTRTLIEANIDALFTIDQEGIITDVNAQFCEMTGYHSQDLIGTSFKQYCTNPQRAEQAIRTTLALHLLRNYEIGIHTPGTQELIVALNATTLAETEHQVLSILVAARDISEQKRAEEALHQAKQKVESQYHRLEQVYSESRAILDAADEAMLLLAPDGEVLMFNRRFREFFPQIPDDLIHQSAEILRSLCLPLFLDQAFLSLWLDRSLANHQESFSEDVLQLTPVRRDFKLNSVPVRSKAEIYLGRLYVLRDVTQEQELERMKRDFVAEVAHELKTPLTSIKGFVELLLEASDRLNKEQKEFLQIVQENATRLATLVNDLLDVSRIESGNITLERTSVILHPLIRRVLQSFTPQISGKHQIMEIHLTDPSPVVFADANRVEQIVSNLISNAHKYTLDGGTLRISTQIEEQWVRVMIQDNGIGMTADELAQLFTRFFRAKNQLTKEVGGTGLGLAITHSLVKLHGGVMHVESTPGKGSTFSFMLPLITEPSSLLFIDAQIPPNEKAN